ncbi:MAG TPA: hypothetical protein PLB91_10615 [Spirochaetales bacterium]|nr:hypothetical protein [Spirochaetales bacterium]HRY54611.1 hypothetical protein [Spirochaetia bacterium]HRZ64293.1 hypothetical protein [Spirochaetia bacterium]
MDLNMIVYLAITAAVAALAIACLFAEEKPTRQATAAMVVVPLLLRLFLIK